MSEIKAETASMADNGKADHGHFDQLKEDVHQNRTDMIAGFFKHAGEDIYSHQIAIKRLNACLEAQHATLVEMTDMVNEHATILEGMAEEIRRLKAWTGCPEQEAHRPTLFGTVGVMRDMLLRIWTHVGLPEDDVMPKTKGVMN